MAQKFYGKILGMGSRNIMSAKGFKGAEGAEYAMESDEPRISPWIVEPKCALCQMLSSAIGYALECDGEYQRAVMAGEQHCEWRNMKKRVKAPRWKRFSDGKKRKQAEGT